MLDAGSLLGGEGGYLGLICPIAWGDWELPVKIVHVDAGADAFDADARVEAELGDVSGVGLGMGGALDRGLDHVLFEERFQISGGQSRY